MNRTKRSHQSLIINIIVFFAAATIAFFVTRLILTSNLFSKPGVITYDESLSQTELDFLKPILDREDIKLKHDVIISATVTPTPDTNMQKYLIYDISVPVADFYYAPGDILSSELDSTPDVQLISINQLTPQQKLLSLDGHYFLDDFKQGALYRIFQFDGPEPAEVIDLIQPHLPKFPTADNTLSLNQTGVTALARRMLTKLNEVGDATYFSQNVANFLQSADLTHLSNEVSFADDCTTSAGSTTLCADHKMMDVIKAVGADIIELTGNHNNDYGAEANIATITEYEKLGLKTFGGGKDEESAATPLQIDQKSAKITLLGYNQSTSTKANGQGASGNHPGANIYDDATFRQDLAAAKERGDFVIVDVQYFECYSYPDYGAEMPECDAPITNQQEFFRSLIDAGADMVIGTQAHQPQTFELYQNKPIYYGLGNLFFDQTYWPGTTRSLILTHYFIDGKYVQTRITPTIYDENYQPTLMDSATATQFIDRLKSSSPSLSTE